MPFTSWSRRVCMNDLWLPEPMTTWTTEESWFKPDTEQFKAFNSFKPWTYSGGQTGRLVNHNRKLITYSDYNHGSQVRPLSVAVFFFRTLFRWSRYPNTTRNTSSISSFFQNDLARSERALFRFLRGRVMSFNHDSRLQRENKPHRNKEIFAWTFWSYIHGNEWQCLCCVNKKRSLCFQDDVSAYQHLLDLKSPLPSPC